MVACAVTAGLSANAMAAQYGAWEQFYTVSSNGNPLCGIDLQGRDRAFYVKYEANVVGLFVELFKNGWNIPPSQSLRVAMQVDQAPVMILYGSGRSLPSGMSGVDIVIGLDDVWKVSGKSEVVEFINLLSYGKSVRFYFPDGDEPGWEGNLIGSQAAFDAMMTATVPVVWTASGEE
jgi:hypothetical protein